jgi:4-hydroxybenzoate polyprenyltransferase
MQSVEGASRFGLELERQLHRAGHFARLLRLHRPIGIWLLMWPVLWALWIAGDGTPTPKLVVIFVLGVIVMRSAGCVVNDLADRDYDPYVRRTRDRPIASRCVSPREGVVVFVLLLAAAFALVLQLDRTTVLMSFVGAALAITYPFFKRFFPLPQFYLGVAFTWGVPMVFNAELGQIPRVAWTLFFAGIIWAAIYDTMYAMVDRDDDLKIGVKSSAIMFGDMDRVIIGVLQAMMLLALHLAGSSMQFGLWYELGLVGAAVFFVYQQWLIRKRDADGCFRAFLNNNFVGMSVFIGVLLEYTFRGS